MSLTERLRRLRQMPAREIARRVRHGAGLVWDRAEVSLELDRKRSCREVLGPALRNAVQSGPEQGIAQTLAAHFRTRTAPQFYFGRSDHEQLMADHARLFPGRRQEIMDEAERVCAHEFRIFAYPPVQCGPEIPWRRDLVHGQETGLQHFSRIPYLDFAQAGDSKIVWEPNRHQHFVTLGQAYFLSGDERYPREFAAQWGQWCAANPHHRGINWASSLELAFRLWSWLWAFHLMLDSEAVAELLPDLLPAIHEHAEHVLANLSTYFSPNTHLLGEGFALYAIGLMFPELRRAEVWRRTGREILGQEIHRQVFRDGVHREQSSYYHRYALEFFICAAALAEKNGEPFPAEYREQLDRMADALAYGSFPGGRDRMAGDSDGGRLLPFAPFDPNDSRPALTLAAAYLQRGDLGALAGTCDESAFWLLGSGSAGTFSRKAAAPARDSRIFPEAGLVAMRSGRDENARVLFFDAGPQGLLGCGHGHADALSITCASDGRQWLVDPGTYVYTASLADRERFRSTRAHNTVVVDGQDQAVAVAAFKWRDLPEVKLERGVCLASMDVAVASHSGYQRLPGRVTHRRTVVFVKPDYWLVRDELSGTGVHDLEFPFHFAPDCAPEAVANGCVIRQHGGFALLGSDPMLEWTCTNESNRDALVAWYSRDYGRRQPAPVVVARKRTTLPFECSWLLCPGSAAAQLTAAGDQVRVQVEEADDRFRFSAPESGDAEFVFARRDPQGVVRRIVLLNGIGAQGDGFQVESEQRLESLEVVGEPGGSLRISRQPACGLRVVMNNETLALSQGTDVPKARAAGEKS